MALITPGDIDNWIGRSVGSERQDEVTSCIAFSQQWIANQAGLRSLEKESAPVVAYFDSEDAWGCDLWIPMSLRPMWHTGSTLVTITENGTTLTSAIGYSTTAGVTLRGVNSFERVRLTRLGGWGSSYVGANNIALTCTCGFDGASGATTNPLPPDVKRLVMEVAWLMFNSAGRVGVNNTNKAGSSVDILNDLSPMSNATLDMLRGV